MPESVQSQVTDAVTQTSNHVLGLGPASASINSYLSQSQSLSILFANMVNQQQQQATVSLATTTQNVRNLLSLHTSLANKTGPVNPEPPANKSGTDTPTNKIKLDVY